MRVLQVETTQAYPVYIGRSILAGCGEPIKKIHRPCRIGLVSDSIVEKIYLNLVLSSLEHAGFHCTSFVFPAGEASKNLTTYGQILEFFASAQLTRSDLIVALGGGVTGDMTGFAAATYLRGVPWLQLPTTLLAAVDASVGGKTAVNLSYGKNLAGAFHQPRAVIFDTACLDTLTQPQLQDGVAEMIKHGAIADQNLFHRLTEEFSTHSSDLEEIIGRNIEIKKSFVDIDEQDQGLRQLLNFGHTIGHSIEKCSAYQISHGHAVAIGMLVETRAAHRLGLSQVQEETIYEALKRQGLPCRCPYSSEQIYQAALGDKKRNGNQISLVKLVQIGQAELFHLDLDTFRQFVDAGMEDW